MNKKYFSIIIFAVVIGFLFYGCEKDPDLRMPDLKKAVTPWLYLTETSDVLVDYYNPLDFQGEMVVDHYWESEAPESMDIIVTYNQDFKNTAVFKSDVTTFPSTFQFTVQELIDLLPNIDAVDELSYNDRFDFYADITMKDGTVLHGADTLYAIGSSDISNYPGGSTSVFIGFKCTYDQANAVGSYYSFSAPDQWNSKGNITITADPNDPTIVYVAGLAAIELLTEDKGPLVMHIDPETFEVTADRTVIASDFFGYTNGAYEGTGTFASCTGNFEMTFEITVDEGSFGAYPFTFTRN